MFAPYGVYGGGAGSLGPGAEWPRWPRVQPPASCAAGGRGAAVAPRPPPLAVDAKRPWGPRLATNEPPPDPTHGAAGSGSGGGNVLSGGGGRGGRLARGRLGRPPRELARGSGVGEHVPTRTDARRRPGWPSTPRPYPGGYPGTAPAAPWTRQPAGYPNVPAGYPPPHAATRRRSGPPGLSRRGSTGPLGEEGPLGGHDAERCEDERDERRQRRRDDERGEPGDGGRGC